MSIKQQVTKSVFWSAVERFSVQGVQFILSLIIARLLLPADYGLIAMLSIFMSIAQTFIDSGFANALIQKKDRTDADYSTVFYFNIVISVLIYLLLYMSSPWIAKFYEEDQLAPIARGIGLTLIINSFGIVQQAKMTISLDFKRQAQASLSAVIVRAVYPIQCRLQDDEEALSRMFLRYMRMACFLVFPVMLILCALADPLVRLLLTDKWIEAVPLLQILCIAYMWDPVMKINNSLLNVKGRSDYFLYAEILKKTMAFLILFATIPLGVKGMCAGLILYSFVDMIIITYYTRKLTRLGMFVQICELSPILFLTFTMGGIVYVITLLSIPPFAQLVIGGSVGIAYYLYLSYLFNFQEFDLIKHLVKEKINL